jgi:hypothetical protein
MYARRNRYCNERGSETNYVRSSVPHYNSPLKSAGIPYKEWLSKEMIIRSTNVTDMRILGTFFNKTLNVNGTVW